MIKKLVCAIMVGVMCFVFVACEETEVSKTATGEKKEEKQEEAAFEEVVFVDDENCTFKITGTEEDEIWGYTLKADLENKSEKNLMFSMEDVSVNGYMCDPFWATSVSAGKKAKSDICFSEDDFKEFGIEEVEEIEFTLEVYNEDDFMEDNLVEEVFVLTFE